MVRTTKYIGLVFMWLAGLIVLVHNIVPHHHHFEVDLAGDVSSQVCCHDHSTNESESHDHQDDCCTHECSETHQNNDQQACHFNVETITQFSKISIDLFAIDTHNEQFDYFSTEEQKLVESQTPKYNAVAHELKPLRGPPAIG